MSSDNCRLIIDLEQKYQLLKGAKWINIFPFKTFNHAETKHEVIQDATIKATKILYFIYLFFFFFFVFLVLLLAESTQV